MKKFSLTYFFFFVLVATMFFEDPRLYLYKRLIYIFFMVLSGWELYLFYFKRPEGPEDPALPRFFPIYLNLVLLFTAYNLVIDFLNPNLNVITLLNHPLAVLAIMPIFAFKVGYLTEDIEKVVKFLMIAAVLFGVFFILPLPGVNKYTPALTCYYAVVPLTAFALYKKKYRLFVVGLIVLSAVFSQVSQSRTTLLRIILFFGLLVSMSMVKRWSILKLTVILVTGYFIYQFMTNLGSWLELFKSYVHVKDFDDSDTRTFLFDEVFSDLKPHEWLLGRGFLGTYFSPYFLWQEVANQDFSGDHYYRFSVEVGFLEFILKGGFVYFILYITPLVVAVYRGLFTRHNSRIAYLLSIYVLGDCLIFFTENTPQYHLNFFLLFFMAGFVCRETAIEARTVPVEIGPNTFLQASIPAGDL